MSRVTSRCQQATPLEFYIWVAQHFLAGKFKFPTSQEIILYLHCRANSRSQRSALVCLLINVSLALANFLYLFSIEREGRLISTEFISDPLVFAEFRSDATRVKTSN
ncbi:unnamed protein product [Rodentolepis nana]|uniref:Uncharacterized protein n=1 Tax=Rodentolepis nana TaxID=102285 RepID=A0A0R3TEF3_RODNA|nr:unnamed protein product [Rodentolepis nana]